MIQDVCGQGARTRSTGGMIDVKVCSRGLRLVQEAHGRYSHSIPWCVSSEERQMYTAHKKRQHGSRVVKLIPHHSVFLFCDIQLKFRTHVALL